MFGEWGIFLKKVEKESLLKSFLLFFLSQSLLIGGLFYLSYQKDIQRLDAEIFSQMRICSFNLQCKEFGIDFVPKADHELYRLYKEKKELSSYFTLPGSSKNYLKIYLKKSAYDQQIANIQKNFIIEFLLVLSVIALLSFVFALYALSPLRNALRLTEEFIKDILHDFNTPLSTLRLNTAMLVSEFGENSKIKRVQNAVQNILNLQSNLRAYLGAHEHQREVFDLKDFIDERLALLASNYKGVTFVNEVPQTQVETNRDALSRIIDNLLSNAGKYNKQNGKVFIRLENNQLIIKDTGKGIQNPKRVFERFYKEQERGIGIGLHIVKKLCDELGIDITLSSEVGVGTEFRLDISKLNHK